MREIPCNTTKIIDKDPNTGAKIPEQRYQVKQFIDGNGHIEEHWIPIPDSDPLKKVVKVFKEDGTEDTDLSHEVTILEMGG